MHLSTYLEVVASLAKLNLLNVHNLMYNLFIFCMPFTDIIILIVRLKFSINEYITKKEVQVLFLYLLQVQRSTLLNMITDRILHV